MSISFKEFLDKYKPQNAYRYWEQQMLNYPKVQETKQPSSKRI